MNHVAIYGGLGNQMFQFALAISMDASGIPTTISANDYLLNRHYQGFELLKAFNVPIVMRERIKLFAVKNVRPFLVDSNGLYVKNLVAKLFNSSSKVFKEVEEYNFDKRVFDQENSFIIGTWQNVKYFDFQRELIKEVFNFNKPKDLLNLKLADEILKKNSIAVHVRRGDYMKPVNAETRMVCGSIDYYTRAFEKIKKSVENPVFYIFSDDISWVKKNFKGLDCVFISHNTGTNSYLDMYLMSLCKHFVIANSSFSWWAAWLSKSSEKQVIMPFPWVTYSACEGIYPAGWQPLDIRSATKELVLKKSG